MAEAKNGDTVKVHYTGSLDDGTEFDSSRDSEPLEFTLGENQVIPGFERAVVGMCAGDSKSVIIPVDDAYGPHRTDMVALVKPSQFPENIDPKIGLELQLVQDDGSKVMVKITDISDEGVTLDANHPLAGEDLVFDIQLVEIV